MKEKIGNIAVWSLLLIGVVLLVSFENRKYEQAVVSDIAIAIESVQGGHFITLDEVEALLIAHHPGLTSTFVNTIQLDALEEELLAHPSVRQVQAFCKMDGALTVKIEQRVPVLRIQSNETAFYLDTDGHRVPLSPNFSIAVPIVTGAVYSDQQVVEVFSLWQKIAHEATLKELIGGIERTSKGEFWLYPIKGRHKVLLGKATAAELRLKKLAVFYEKAMDVDLDKHTQWIDLRYKNQVIVKK